MVEASVLTQIKSVRSGARSRGSHITVTLIAQLHAGVKGAAVGREGGLPLVSPGPTRGLVPQSSSMNSMPIPCRTRSVLERTKELESPLQDEHRSLDLQCRQRDSGDSTSHQYVPGL